MDIPDSVTCQSCKRKIIPVISFNYQGKPLRSFCPICGNLYQELEKPKLERKEKIIVVAAILIMLFVFYMTAIDG